MGARQKKSVPFSLFGLILSIFSAAAYGQEPCPLNGVWLSNEKMTLESMNRHGNVSEKQRALFEDSFFGRLKVDVGCNQFTTTLDDFSETVEYEIAEMSGSSVTTRYVDALLGKMVERTLVVKEGCYSVPIEHLGFREYFCRAK